MAEKLSDGEKGGESGREGASSRTSLRSLLHQPNSKESAASSSNLSSSRLFKRSRSGSKPDSRPSSMIESDSYVVVTKDEVPQPSIDVESTPPPPVTAALSKGSPSTPRLKREPTIEGVTKTVAEDGQESPFESDSGMDREKKKETSRFFSPPKMRGTMFPFDQISVPMSSHRQKNIELHRIFNSLDTSEKLIDDYSCALQRDILVHGRLYVTQNWLCFYANIFTWETLITIPFSSVTAITKERTAFVFPNAVQVATTAEKYGFSSLMSRDITYNVLFKVWQNSLLDEHLSPLELVKAARRASGDSIDVGTADELWGSDDNTSDLPDSTAHMTKTTTSLPAILPTHVEIMPSVGNGSHFPASISEIPLIAGGNGQLLPSHGTTATTQTALPQEEHRSRKADSEGTTSNTTAGTPSQQQRQQQIIPLSSKPSKRRTLSGDRDTQSIGNGVNSTPRGSSDRTPATMTPMTPAGEMPEMVSMGGESFGSLSEDFETMSFADEPGEIPCGCTEHVGRSLINDVYAADVETIFQLLFTDDNFFRDFLLARNTINVDIGDWQEQPTDGSRLRDLNYTVALNYSFGPKFSPTTEHQVYSSSGQPGLKHLVHTEVNNRNIPYSETFYVSCQYCMTRVAHDKARLRITANINYRKSCWGVVKNLIEKNAGDGLRSYYNHLDSFLKEHLASLPVHCRSKHYRKRQRHISRVRHRKAAAASAAAAAAAAVQAPVTTPSPTNPANESPPPSLPSSPVSRRQTALNSTSSLYSLQLNGSTHNEHESPSSLPDKTQKIRSSSFPQVNMALTLLLGILIVSNMALYHHLMSYQSPSSSATTSGTRTVDPLTENLEWPTTNQEWIAFTRRHLERQEAERQRWLDTLAALVTTLDQAESFLSVAKRLLTEQIQANDKRFPNTRSMFTSPSSASFSSSSAPSTSSQPPPLSSSSPPPPPPSTPSSSRHSSNLQEDRETCDEHQSCCHVVVDGGNAT